MIDAGALGFVLLSLGNAGMNEPIMTGVVVFGITGAAIAYLSFVRHEFDAGLVLKAGTVMLFALALLSYYWPSRPWPH